MNDELLRASGMTKRYVATVLDAVDFELRAGEVHALLGANGAGKSTLAKIVSGLVRADAGGMTIGGAEFRPVSKLDAERQGVEIVQQELNVIANLTVAENLFLNRLPARFGCIDYRTLHRDARDAMALVGLDDVPPWTPVESLGIGKRQLLEVAAALSRKCRVLILDEPTAALTSREVDTLFEQVRGLRASGTGIVYVSHRLEEIRRLADRATFLRDGRVVGTREVADLSVDDMVQLMAGSPAARRARSSPTALSRDHDPSRDPTTDIALRVVGLTREPGFRDVSVTIRRGECVGIAGLVGSGRTELLRAIFGADRADAGAVFAGNDSRPRRFRSPRDAVRAGLALVTEDRKRDGLLLPQALRVNATLASLHSYRGALRATIRRKREHADVERLASELDIRAASIEQLAGELSGGNQQKVVVGKWLLRDPEVLLLDEPTRGIDVAAREQLYALLDELKTRGKALVVVSSELEELMKICDRIVVMSAGRLVAEFGTGEWSQDAIMAAAFGALGAGNDGGGDDPGEAA